jgi:hypothetical protein
MKAGKEITMPSIKRQGEDLIILINRKKLRVRARHGLCRVYVNQKERTIAVTTGRTPREARCANAVAALFDYDTGEELGKEVVDL